MLLLSFLLLGWISASEALPEAEIASLKAIYESTGGPGWKKSTNWMSNVDPCESWYGVMCGAITGFDSNVVQIELPNNNLVGTLPFITFPYLKYVDLSLNAFTGPLPDMSGLVSLSTLWLFTTGITGPIPPLPPSIEFINMQDNAMTGSIPPFTNNTLISTLHLDGNKFTGAIPEFTTLSQLRHLYLGDNPLTSMPASFAHNPLLEEIDMIRAQLTGPMSDISANTKLTRINLENNKLTGSPPSFTALQKLNYLDLSGNQFNGTLPVISSPAITYIDFTLNYFTGPVSYTSYANSSSLTALGFGCNYLTPPLPTWPPGHTPPQLDVICFDGRTNHCDWCGPNWTPPTELYDSF